MCEIHGWDTLVFAIWAIIEFWLGKTDIVKAGSSIEIILNLIKALVKRLPFIINKGD